jgi:hypothetical protein
MLYICHFILLIRVAESISPPGRSNRFGGCPKSGTVVAVKVFIKQQIVDRKLERNNNQNTLNVKPWRNKPVV